MGEGLTRCKVLPGKAVGRKAAAGVGEEAKVGSPGKFGDEEGKGKEGVLQAGANETWRALLPEGGCPPGDPPGSPPRPRGSGPGRRSSLTSGLKLLWAELRGASAAASASRGSSGLRAGRAAGDMVRGRPGRRACGSAAGPSLGVAPPLPRTPLSPGGPELGFLESCPLGEEALVPERACLLVASPPFSGLSSA